MKAENDKKKKAGRKEKEAHVADIEDQISTSDAQASAARVTHATKGLVRSGAIADISRPPKKDRRPRKGKQNESAETSADSREDGPYPDVPTDIDYTSESDATPLAKKVKKDSGTRKSITAARKTPSDPSVNEAQSAVADKSRMSPDMPDKKKAQQVRATSVDGISGTAKNWTSAVDWNNGVPPTNCDTTASNPDPSIPPASKKAPKLKAALPTIPSTPPPAKKGTKPPKGAVKETVPKTPLNVQERGIISDDESAEQDAAMSSPEKNGKRLTSNGIVTVTSKSQSGSSVKVDSDVQVKVEESDEIKHSDTSKDSKDSEGTYKMPAELSHRFKRRFMPTVIKLVGRLNNPWSFVELGAKQLDASIQFLEILWFEIYGPTVPVPQPIKPFCKLVTQELAQWRSAMASAALRLLHDYFLTDPTTAFNNEERAEEAQDMLKDLWFLFEKAHAKPYTGLFRSAFVLRTMTHFVSSTHGAIEFSDHNITSVNVLPVGAIALTAAAVERAVWLWAEERVTISSSGQIDYPKRPFNPKAPKESKYHHHFSDLRWGSVTRAYVVSAKNLAASKVSKIMDLARPTSTTMSDDDDDKGRAALVDVSSDSEQE
ncbi:hypothetical protein A0H81_10254 [Grifola frondosa]|uniref:DUF6532 domain-containing protein n=1 Tax=Grifola frondosa TaxID=5627 RepID=A0A1C7LYV0_GRIFR|nr:hypothetical protein A0H81_10254 [Grifola frondosa]